MRENNNEDDADVLEDSRQARKEEDEYCDEGEERGSECDDEDACYWGRCKSTKFIHELVHGGRSCRDTGWSGRCEEVDMLCFHSSVARCRVASHKGGRQDKRHDSRRRMMTILLHITQSDAGDGCVSQCRMI